jgi:hypothetical protein
VPAERFDFLAQLRVGQGQEEKPDCRDRRRISGFPYAHKVIMEDVVGESAQQAMVLMIVALPVGQWVSTNEGSKSRLRVRALPSRGAAPFHRSRSHRRRAQPRQGSFGGSWLISGRKT